MKRNNLLLSMGFSPGYLKKIGVNFFVAAAIMAFLMATEMVQTNLARAIVMLVFFAFGLLCFGISSLKMKYYGKHWQKIGEPELAPQELRRAVRHFAEFGLLILFFIGFKTLLLKRWPDAYDVTGIVIPFLICGYLLWKSRRRRE